MLKKRLGKDSCHLAANVQPCGSVTLTYVVQFSTKSSASIWVLNQKKGGKTPPNHPFVNRVFHYFHHPFWVFFYHYFWVDTHFCLNKNQLETGACFFFGVTISTGLCKFQHLARRCMQAAKSALKVCVFFFDFGVALGRGLVDRHFPEITMGSRLFFQILKSKHVFFAKTCCQCRLRTMWSHGRKPRPRTVCDWQVLHWRSGESWRAEVRLQLNASAQREPNHAGAPTSWIDWV